MDQPSNDDLWQLALSLNWQIMVAVAVAAVVLLLILMVIVRLLTRRRGQPTPEAKLARIDIEQLNGDGPPATGSRVEIYGTPVRIAAVVLAPLGRDSVLPTETQVPRLADQIVPGLQDVLEAHDPLVVRWPEQLSWHGFTQAFFSHAPLPGDRGKGTPWCSVAGKFTVSSVPLVAGFVCCAAHDNPIGQVVIEHDGQWLDVLRVRTEA